MSKLVPALLEWFATNARKMPWRETHDPYAVWVSEIMLQQTQVKTVIPYWERWMRDLPDVAALAAAPAAKVLKLWEGLGYYSRARNLHAAAQLIVEKFGGHFPRAFSDILELPGVGRYTAGAIASIAYNDPAPILDGNVMRVLTRVFGIDGDPRGKATNQQLWALAAQLVEHAANQPHSAKTRACSHLNQSLMELGALVCTPRQPACPACPVRQLCVAQRDQRTQELPALAPRGATTARRFVAFVITRGNRHLVQQRPSGVVNAGLWEFPNLELKAAATPPAERVALPTGRIVRATTSLGSLTHSITRYRITVEVFRAELLEDSPQPDEHWVSATELEELAFTSAHRKIVARLG
ncbi:A/G-specific adenine glycosylase [Verrucomicrobiota bacterium]|nr:A/G-specific adenine glycosylase [Verrucomicrobiota bacterium]